jgi:hypothetical protein
MCTGIHHERWWAKSPGHWRYSLQVEMRFLCYRACTWTHSAQLASVCNSSQLILFTVCYHSGLYLQRELHSRGHEVTLYNRGKTANQQLPGESDAEFEKRSKEVKTIIGDRKDAAVIKDVSLLWY